MHEQSPKVEPSGTYLEAKPPATSSEPEFKYWAFISHSRKDKKWGIWLQHAIETYRVPKNFRISKNKNEKVSRACF